MIKIGKVGIVNLNKYDVFEKTINKKFIKKVKLERWSDNDDLKLKQLFIEGVPNSKISKILNKSRQAVTTRLWRMKYQINQGKPYDGNTESEQVFYKKRI